MARPRPRASRSRRTGNTPAPKSAGAATATHSIAPSSLALAWTIVIAALVISVTVRLRLADMPLERDEGEYAYAGQLIRQGLPPYSLAYNMKFPGVYYAYAAILSAFGETPGGVRAGLLLVNAATIVVLFFLGRRLAGSTAGAIGALLYAALSLDGSVEGVAAHATHFAVLPIAGAAALLASPRTSRPFRVCAAAGVLLGLAVLMKQQAAVLVACIVLGEFWIARRQSHAIAPALRRAAIIVGASLVPLAIVATVLAAQGVLGRAVFWTVTYARAYISEITVSDGLSLAQFAFAFVTQKAWPIWIAAAAGLALIWRPPVERDAALRLIALAAGGAAAVCPGFYFRPHYFIVLLPVVALLAGVACVAAGRAAARVFDARLTSATATTLAALLVLALLLADAPLLFSLSPREASRLLYPANPFLEAEAIASYLRSHTSPDDRIAVLGSEPEIYFEAGRRSATGYIYTYGLMEAQPYAGRMQDEMMREIETAHPVFIVAAHTRNSWLTRPSSDRRILRWMPNYLSACYEHIGAGDIRNDARTSLRWDADLRGYEPTTMSRIDTYRRRGTEPCAAPR